MLDHCVCPDTEAILVIGGFDGRDVTSDVEIVVLNRNPNVTTGECRIPRPLPEAMSGMVGYFSEEEDLAFVCGGRNTEGDPVSKCYTYSLMEDVWEEAQFRMEEKRYDAAGVVLKNGSLLVVGGYPSWSTSELPKESLEGPELPYEVGEQVRLSEIQRLFSWQFERC